MSKTHPIPKLCVLKQMPSGRWFRPVNAQLQRFSCWEGIQAAASFARPVADVVNAWPSSHRLKRWFTYAMTREFAKRFPCLHCYRERLVPGTLQFDRRMAGEVIVDTDTGVDDATGCVLALQRPDFDVVGLTPCLDAPCPTASQCAMVASTLKEPGKEGESIPSFLETSMSA